MSHPDPSSGRATGPQVARDLVGGLVMLAVVAVFLLNAGGVGLDWLFPIALSYALGALAIYFVLRGLLRFGDRMPAVPLILRGEGVDVAVFVFLTVAYAVLAPRVGFWPMSAITIFVAAVYLDTARSKLSTALALVVALIVCVVGYFVLTGVFYIRFPPIPWR